MITNRKIVTYLSTASLLVALTSLPVSAMAHITHTFTDYKVLPNGGTHVWMYNCPAGHTVVNGGFDSVFNAANGKGLRLIESYPSAANQWRWTFFNEGPLQAQYRLVVICDHS
ncbi:MAG: hypothetical protein ACREXM_04970 [Gammaproteobacteria bacterium]